MATTICLRRYCGLRSVPRHAVQIAINPTANSSFKARLGQTREGYGRGLRPTWNDWKPTGGNPHLCWALGVVQPIASQVSGAVKIILTIPTLPDRSAFFPLCPVFIALIFQK